MSTVCQGGHSHGKPGIVREFKSGQGKVREFDHDWRVATLVCYILYFALVILFYCFTVLFLSYCISFVSCCCGSVSDHLVLLLLVNLI